MATFPVTRVGTILAVSDVKQSCRFYAETLGFALDAVYDDPPYATLTRDGVRLSLAQQGYSSPDRPGVEMTAPIDRSKANVVVVLEVADCAAVYRQLSEDGVKFLAEPYSPPWGGERFFCVDPDGYLVEVEQLA